MGTLAEIIAVEKSKKARAESTLTEAHHKLQKPALINGQTRTYAPRDENGEEKPAEVQLVQVHVRDEIKNARTALAQLFDVTATKDWGNTVARADIVVDEKVLLAAVPVTYLLFLEKQLVNLVTFVDKLPVHDPSVEWHENPSTGTWVSQPEKSVSTKKAYRNHRLAPATQQHAEQVQVYTEDEPVGEWSKIRHTSALPSTQKDLFRTRVEKLQDAVKIARERANHSEVKDQHVGDTVLGYIFG